MLKDQFKQLGYNRILKKVNSIDEDINTSELKIIDVKLSFKKPFKISDYNSSRYVIKLLSEGHKLGLRKDVAGLLIVQLTKSFLIKGILV